MIKRNLQIILGIGLLLILVYLSIFGISFLFDYRKPLTDNTGEKYFIISEMSSPAYMKWIDNENILFSTYDFTSGTSTLFTYNITKRELINNYSINKEGIFGITDEMEMIFCSWKNQKIFDPNEYATIISLSTINETSSEEIVQLNFHETIALNNCDLTELEAMNDHPSLPLQDYIIDVSQQTITATTPNITDLNALESYNTPQGISVINYLISPDESFVLIEDINGVLLISSRKP